MGLSTLRFRLHLALVPLVVLVVGLVLTVRYGVGGLTLAVPGGFLLLRVLTASGLRTSRRRPSRSSRLGPGERHA